MAELALSVQSGEGSGDCPATRPRLRRWVLAALRQNARITIRFVGRREGRALNLAHRGRDYATNVLTFAYEPPLAGGSTASPTLGMLEADIVICLPVVRSEARSQRKPIDHHLAHLVIHGVLHAQGFDHLEDAQAQIMESIETALLARFRIPDPYAVEHAPH